jgi:ATP:ADP antiporter, AAA family
VPVSAAGAAPGSAPSDSLGLGLPDPKRTWLESLLGLFTDVEPGEAGTALLMFLNLFLLLLGYYVLRTLREPLILASGAEVASYSAAGQALALMGFVPLYGRVASKVNRSRLILGFILFFVICIELFSLAGHARLPYVGVVYYVWVGIFSLATVAQFWSFANDVYRREAGERLFPFIFLGATLGAPVGA